MKLLGIETARSSWLLVIGVGLGVYLWFFLMVFSKFIDIKNEKIAKRNAVELQSLKKQIAAMQRFKSDTVVTEENIPSIPYGFSQIYTPHFTIYSFNAPLLRELTRRMEKIYDTIIADTNLYNFNPFETFTIYIYKDAQMYKDNTKRAEWSGGFVYNRVIYTFAGKHLDYVLPHETTHLIFNDFMDGKAGKISLWVNEGLAMYAENKLSILKKSQFDKLKRMNMNDFLALDLFSAEVEKVAIWYSQAESLIRFMLEKRAKIKFYNFLTRLRETENIDEALFWGYQSEFKNMSDLENAWLKE